MIECIVYIKRMTVYGNSVIYFFICGTLRFGVVGVHNPLGKKMVIIKGLVTI